MAARKLTQDFVQKEFHKRNWTLLSQYKNSREPLNVICPNGHKFAITWNSFQKGNGCKYCANLAPHSYEYVNNYFTEHGCKLLTTEYKNTNQKLDHICECGNFHSITFSNFKNGNRCPYCKQQKILDKNGVSKDKIIKVCEQYNCQYISHDRKTFKKYKNRIFIKFKCHCGNVSEMAWNNFKRIGNCPICGLKKKSGENSPFWKQDRESLQIIKILRNRCYHLVRRTAKQLGVNKNNKKYNILGYTANDLQQHLINHPNFLEEWKNLPKDQIPWDKIHIDHIFPIKAFIDHQIYNIKLINDLSNLRPLPAYDNLVKSSSYNEEEFLNWLDSMGYKYNNISKDFEEWKQTFNSNNIEVILYDKIFVNPKGVQIIYNNIINKSKIPIIIFPHEWLSRKKQWISHIEACTGVFNKRLYARSCLIKEVSKTDLRGFCNEYHIQGANHLSIVSWGIFFEDELLGVISLGKHHRQINELVLDRLCFKSGVQIIGGSARLFSRCKNWAKSHGYNSILSYSDNRYSLGNVYDKLKFTLEENLNPDYFYVDKNDITKYYSKQSQKKKSSGCPFDKTELQWTIIRGLVRAYDCGKKRWRIYL